VCGVPWVDPTLPTGIYLDTPSVAVLQATGAEYKVSGGTTFQPLRAGMSLRAGTVVRVRAGSILDLNSAKGSIRTPPGGMPGKNESVLAAVDREFLDSIRMGDSERSAALLAKGANVNALDSFGRTPLMLAAQHGDTSLVGMLLDHGADAFRQTPRGFSAADFAAMGRHGKVLAALAHVGATEKSPKTLAPLRNRPDVEEPWYVFIGSHPVSRPRQASFHVPNTRLQEEWTKEALNSGGVAGPPLTIEQAKAALTRYMQTGFAHEHPNLTHSSQAK